MGSEILLDMDGFLQLCLHSTFEMGRYFPDEKIFDLLMHVRFHTLILGFLKEQILIFNIN